MKWLVPAIIIGLVGGILDSCTSLHKIWCFLLGVASFYVFLLLKSLWITFKLFEEAGFKKRISFYQDQSGHYHLLTNKQPKVDE